MCFFQESLPYFFCQHGDKPYCCQDNFYIHYELQSFFTALAEGEDVLLCIAYQVFTELHSPALIPMGTSRKGMFSEEDIIVSMEEVITWAVK